MAIKFLADENFDGRIVSGLRRQAPSLDLIRVQDTALSGADDVDLLAFAAANERLLLTHDRRTIPGYAANRVRTGENMPGVVIVAAVGSIQVAIDAVLLLAGASFDGEWEAQVLTLP